MFSSSQNSGKVTFKLKLQAGKISEEHSCSVETTPMLNFLGHAQLEELDIGSQCGGQGICGKDRIRVTPQMGLSPFTESEQFHLTPEELRSGIRLACQCFPNHLNNSYAIEPQS